MNYLKILKMEMEVVPKEWLVIQMTVEKINWFWSFY